ncbi:hypothetical protein CPC08DRAFT_517851 [Agrocybe pediades]|nr:hypothetical protein CPC08DRAFT_517851 [Agrocybe pediades]
MDWIVLPATRSEPALQCRCFLIFLLLFCIHTLRRITLCLSLSVSSHIITRFILPVFTTITRITYDSASCIDVDYDERYNIIIRLYVFFAYKPCSFGSLKFLR